MVLRTKPGPGCTPLSKVVHLILRILITVSEDPLLVDMSPDLRLHPQSPGILSVDMTLHPRVRLLQHLGSHQGLVRDKLARYHRATPSASKMPPL